MQYIYIYVENVQQSWPAEVIDPFPATYRNRNISQSFLEFSRLTHILGPVTHFVGWEWLFGGQAFKD